MTSRPSSDPARAANTTRLRGIDVVVRCSNEQGSLAASIPGRHDTSRPRPFTWGRDRNKREHDHHAQSRASRSREIAQTSSCSTCRNGPRARARAGVAGQRRGRPRLRGRRPIDRPAALLPLLAAMVSGTATCDRDAPGARRRVVRGPKARDDLAQHQLDPPPDARRRFSDAQCGFKAIRSRPPAARHEVRDEGSASTPRCSPRQARGA